MSNGYDRIAANPERLFSSVDTLPVLAGKQQEQRKQLTFTRFVHTRENQHFRTKRFNIFNKFHESPPS